MLKTANNAFTSFEESFKTTIPYVYGMIGAMCLTGSAFFAKQISYLPTFQLALNRSIALLALTYPLMRLQKQDLGTKKPELNRFLILRGLLEFGALGFYYIALKFLPISEATIIIQTCPTIVGLLGAIFLGEKYELSMVLTTICCMTGIVFVAKPAFLFQGPETQSIANSSRTLGVLWTVISACFLGMTQIVVRKISGQTNSGTLVIHFPLISAFVSSVIVIHQEVQTLSMIEVCFTVLVSLFSLGGQIFRNRALKYGKAGKVAMMAYTQIVWAFLLDIFVTDVAVDKYSMIGAIWISSCLFIFIYQNFSKDKALKN